MTMLSASAIDYERACQRMRRRRRIKRALVLAGQSVLLVALLGAAAWVVGR